MGTMTDDERDAALAEGFRVGIEACASYLDGVAAYSSRRAAQLRANEAGASPERRAALAALHERAASFAAREARHVRDLPMPPSMPAALREAEEAQRQLREAIEGELAALAFDADDRARCAEAERDAALARAATLDPRGCS